MQQLIISIFLHLILVIIVSISQVNNKSTKQAGGCSPGSVKIISVTLKADIPQTTQKKFITSEHIPDKKNLMLIKDKKEKKQTSQYRFKF